MVNNIAGDIRQNDWNIDRALIFLIPIFLLSILFLMPSEWLLESSLLCISIFIYILITYKYRLVYGFSGIRIASIPSIIVATFTLFISIPSIYVLMIRDHPNEFAYFYSILLFYLLFPVGLFFGQLFREIDLNKSYSLLKEGITKHNNDKYFYEVTIILFSISILIFCGYLLRVDELPLIELIKDPGNSTKFFYMREEALKTLSMTKIERYLFHWLRSLFIPFGIIASLSLTSMYSKKKYKYLFISFFVIGLIVNSITLEKSPLASIFLSIAAYIFLKREKVKPSLIIILAFFTLTGPLLITYFLIIDREDIFDVILWSYINRIFVTPAEVLFYYFQYFPETHEFLLGRSTQLFSWMFSEGTFPLSNYVAKLWWKIPDTTGSANANFLGTYWANFGWYGTTIFSIIFGFIVHLLQWKIFQVSCYKKNIIFIISITIAIPSFTFGFLSSNFTIIFFTKGLLLLVMFLFSYDFWKKTISVEIS